MIWLLDNGHGIDTQFKESKPLDNGLIFKEYEFNRLVIKLLSFMLKADKIEHEIIVPEIEDISLHERVKRANQIYKQNKNCVYLSVHSNKFEYLYIDKNFKVRYDPGKFGYINKNRLHKKPIPDWNRVNGIETYYCKGSTKGHNIARIFQYHLINDLNLKDRGIKTANFTVLLNTLMPAILTETGFYSNKNWVNSMMTCSGLDNQKCYEIALSHFNAIKEIENNIKL